MKQEEEEEELKEHVEVTNQNVRIPGNDTIETSVINKDCIVEEDRADDDDCSAMYQPRTFRPHSINSQRRSKLLPAYPQGKDDTNDRTLLLLSNVPHTNRNILESNSFCGGYGICPFEFVQHRYVETIDSFMIDIYRDLFIEPSRRWKIPYSFIDYNLSRLRKCMQLYTQQTKAPAILSINEWPIALEFFLQIDVDVFYMKTCNFHGAHPRLFGQNIADASEGIICQAEPVARYGMMPCCERNCFLCKSRYEANGKPVKTLVSFSSNESHRFVNKYETFLNCNANCNTSNVIYALTCRCGQCDFIGSTAMTFHDRILKHRNENNRIVREFLIGSTNIDHVSKSTSQSAEILANNEMLVYQHSPRCSLVLQLFLDNNLDYWCLVPMSTSEARVADRITVSSAMTSIKATHIYTTTVTMPQCPQSSASITKPTFFEDVLKNTTRSEEESIWLSKSVPKPPSGYRFSRRQIEEQIHFFKFKKDTHILPLNLVDFYTYTIIAVLPDDCSHELRRFIEALFITHAETRLNTIGRLTHEGPWSQSLDDSNRGQWCAKLVRQRPDQTKLS